MSTHPLLTRLAAARVVPVVHTSTAARAEKAVRWLSDAGLHCFEIASTMPDALALIRVLASDPALLLLDELSMGLAPLIVDELYETVAQIAQSGVSILCIEQFARTALRVSDYAAVMTGGRIVATGEPEEIMATMSDVILGGAA